MDRRNFLIASAAQTLVFLKNPLSLAGAWSQPTVQVPFQTAKFVWDWVQGSGGMVEEFEITCGTLKKTIADPAGRSILVKDLVPGPGVYICSIVAKNRFGLAAAATSFPPIHVSARRDVVTILTPVQSTG